MNSFSKEDFLSSANKFLGRLAAKLPNAARALDFKLPEKFSYVSRTVEYLVESKNDAADILIRRANHEGRDIMVVRDQFLVGNKQRLMAVPIATANTIPIRPRTDLTFEDNNRAPIKPYIANILLNEKIHNTNRVEDIVKRHVNELIKTPTL
jgi:hypothetical protein